MERSGETTRLYPGRRRRALEAHARAAARMDEPEPAGVKTHAAKRVSPAAVDAVAQHRVAEIGELHADLMPAAGAEVKRQERHVPAPLADLVVRDGETSARTGADTVRAILDK